MPKIKGIKAKWPSKAKKRSKIFQKTSAPNIISTNQLKNANETSSACSQKAGTVSNVIAQSSSECLFVDKQLYETEEESFLTEYNDSHLQSSERKKLTSKRKLDFSSEPGPSTSLNTSGSIETLTDMEEMWISNEEYDSIVNHPLIIERDPLPPPEYDFEKCIQGNRIVNLGYVLKWATKLQYNHSKKCTLGMLYPHKETSRGLGLVSYIEFRCTMCSEEIVHSTQHPKKVQEINISCIWGTLSTGSSYCFTEELLSAMNIPPINKYLYYKIEKDLQEAWHNQIWANMQAAGKEELDLALKHGNIDSEGIPFITVYLDGGWSKRSYGHNYNAASGVAVIIGKATGKLLHLGVRNKYCSICMRAENMNISVKDHICYKNWSSSSSAMEADIIVEGFRMSQEMHGVRYEIFIADGDSSVFAKIREKVPYGKYIRKIECVNHALKNYSKALYTIKSDTKNVNLNARKQLTKDVIEKLLKIAQSAIYNSSYEHDKDMLQTDLKNGIQHIFGNHVACREYYCSNIGNTDQNIIPDIKKTGLYNHISASLNVLISKSDRLLDNETNNRAELFMSILCRLRIVYPPLYSKVERPALNAGKRLNLTNRGSFQMRCNLAGLRYNKGINWHASPWKKIANESPGIYFKKYMQRKQAENNKRKEKMSSISTPAKKKNKKSEKKMATHKNTDYGCNAQQAEMNEEEFTRESDRILSNLKITKEEQIEISKNSVGQFGNPIYEAERSDRLTASVFGKVFRRKKTTPCHNLVKEILYSTTINTPAIEYGKAKEAVAIALFEEQQKVKVHASGLYIDTNYCFLAASPDGIIDENHLCEVKCLYKASQLGWTVKEAAISKTTCLEIVNDIVRLKRNHDYFLQIQGQLNITDRQFCYFIIYINDKTELFIEKIERDKILWERELLPKLKLFYMDCVLPEIVRRRIPQGLKCCDPQYIVTARKEMNNKKTVTKNKMKK